MSIRLPKEKQQEMLREEGVELSIQYGAVKRGYIKLTDEMINNEVVLKQLLKESHAYILTLKPKPTKKKKL